MVKTFDEIKNSLKGYTDEKNNEYKLGSEIAVKTVTDDSLFKQISFLDEQDKAIAIKIMAIKEVLMSPPSFLSKENRKPFIELGKKCDRILKEFMLICKSTDGKTLDVIRDVFASPSMQNIDATQNIEKVLKMKGLR